MVTGETGAGKSIMLGALGLLLGSRADTKVLLDKERKCVIEAEFDIADYGLSGLFENEDLDYESTCLIRREINPAGKSRAFVNDTPVRLDVLKELGISLMDVHSQHETLLLGTHDYQLSVLDAFAQTEDTLIEYREAFESFQIAKNKFENLHSESQRIKKESDYNNFLLNELSETNLRSGEQQELEEELKVLENAEDIKTKLTAALALIDQPEYGTLISLEQVRDSLKQLTSLGPDYEDLGRRAEELYVELIELNRDISDQDERVEMNSERTQEVQDRLSKFYQLQQKHGVLSVDELLEIQNKLEEATLIAQNLDEELDKLETARNECEKKAFDLAQTLSKKRNTSFENLKENIEVVLNSLGIPEGQFQISNEPKELSSNGIDKIEFLFSANKGVPVANLKKTASGGEFTRLMFAIKYLIANKTALPTIVFDEIDTGISGEIALKMGQMMQSMALNHQVIAISHLPQIAAKGDKHFFVFKESGESRSVSRIKVLSEDDRILELAKMIGGDTPSDSAFENARELMSH